MNTAYCHKCRTFHGDSLLSFFVVFYIYDITCFRIGNASVPIQLAQCWLPGLAICNAII